MPALLLDEWEVERVLAARMEAGSYRWVEVWDGVYVVPPLPDNRHSELCGLFNIALHAALGDTPGIRCGGHVNISDRNKDWMSEVRCPDAVVYLPGNPARDRFTHWQGGPDLLVEVVMPGDRSRDKFDFYASVGAREVLIVDRDPWRLELYRLRRGRMHLRGEIASPDGQVMSSAVVPMTFQLVRGRPRPKLKIAHAATSQEWVG